MKRLSVFFERFTCKPNQFECTRPSTLSAYIKEIAANTCPTDIHEMFKSRESGPINKCKKIESILPDSGNTGGDVDREVTQQYTAATTAIPCPICYNIYNKQYH